VSTSFTTCAAKKTSNSLVRGHKGKQQKAGVQVPARHKTKNHRDIIFYSPFFVLYGINLYTCPPLPLPPAEAAEHKRHIFCVII
jgi:hypothetical protein